MPNWRKVVVSGSDAALNLLFVSNAVTASVFSGSFSGSHFGTSSWAYSSSVATSSSYALSSSYVLSSSYALSASSAVSAVNATNIENINVGPSTNVPIAVLSNTTTGNFARVGYASGIANTTKLTYNTTNEVLNATASVAISGSYSLSSSYALTASYALNGGGGGVSDFPYTGSAIISGSLTIIQSGSLGGLIITGSANTASLITSGGFVKIQGSGSGIFTVTGSTGPIFEISDVNAASNKLLAFSSGSVDVFSIYRNRDVEISSSLVLSSGNNTAKIYVSASSGGSRAIYFSASLLPNPKSATDRTSSFDLGSPTNSWRTLWVATRSVYFVDEDTGISSSIGLNSAYGFTYNDFPIINAQGGISSSFPFGVRGSTLYSLFDLETGAAASSNNAVYIGNNAGYSASNSDYSNFIGYNAGINAYEAGGSNFMGEYAGQNAGAAYNSNFFGTSAGDSADSASRSNFLGNGAGYSAINANDSNFFGYKAGWQQNSSNYSNFFGYQAGYRAIGFPLGSNNIIIGTNITLEGNRKDSINLGGILFATGSYSTTTGNPYSGSTGGRIGINVVNPQYELDVLGSANFSNDITVGGSIFATASWAVNALTASSADSFVVRNNITASNGLFTGTITAQTLVVQVVTSSTDFVTGSTQFGSQLTNTHQFTGSVSITGSLSLAGGIANLTSSYAVSSSYATSASQAINAGNASTIDISVFGSPVDSYVLMSNVAGTTGVAVGGDADFRYNSSTNVLTVGSVSATSLTGSLLGTSSWASNAVTASHALSASNLVVTSTLVVDQTITRFASSASSTAGSNIMFNLVTGSYTSAFFKYTVSSGSNMRSGEVISGWSGSTATYTDFAAPDLGNTAVVTASVAISNAIMQFNVSTTTSGWKIKTLATLM